MRRSAHRDANHAGIGVTIENAVGELVQVAFEQFGGIGPTEVIVLRGRSEKLKVNSEKLGKRAMKIYIAGKITGLSGEEAEGNFMWAETVIEKAGHMPLNPLKLVDQAPGRSYMACLLDALRIVDEQADAIYFLSNWHDSWGAIKELEFAKHEGLPVYFAGDELPLGCDWPEQKER